MFRLFGRCFRCAEQVGPWDASDIVCMTDGVLLSAWFMLREIEFGGRRSHLYLSGGKIHLLLPAQKTETQGSEFGDSYFARIMPVFVICND